MMSVLEWESSTWVGVGANLYIDELDQGAQSQVATTGTLALSSTLLLVLHKDTKDPKYNLLADARGVFPVGCDDAGFGIPPQRRSCPSVLDSVLPVGSAAHAAVTAL